MMRNLVQTDDLLGILQRLADRVWVTLNRLWLLWRPVQAASRTYHSEPAPAPRVTAARFEAATPAAAEPAVWVQDRLAFDPCRGQVSCVFPGSARRMPLLEGCTASATYVVAGEERTLRLTGAGLQVEREADGLCVRQNDDYLQLAWHLRLGDQVECWLEAKNIGVGPVSLVWLSVWEIDRQAGGRLNLPAAPRRWSFYQHGWSSWSPTYARHLGESLHTIPDDKNFARSHLPHGNPDAQGILSSEWVTVLWGRGRPTGGANPLGVLFGFVSGARQLAEIRLDADAEAFRSLEARCYADGVPVEPGQRFSSERLMIRAGGEPLALLEGYASRCGEIMSARRAVGVPAGWCTWYYFFGEESEKDVLDNLAEMRQAGLPLDYVIVDDGYQRAIGDWLTPDGKKYTDMRRVAEAIRAEGRHAGLWLAPFGLSPESATFAAHPDWVVRDAAGQPAVGWQHFGVDIYALDLTHPAVGPWLEETFRSLQEWGFEFFKIDFLFAGAVAGQRHNPSATRAMALRRGLESIRRGIGDEAFLLGCGAPQLPCVGLVDGMRVGPDVAANWHPFWADLSMPAAENALRNAVTRAFTHGRLWINDPDCALVRDRDDQSGLVLNEMRTLVGMIALLGGVTISSDNLTTMRKGRFKYLEQMLPPTGSSARALDLFENEMPQCLALPVRRPWGDWLVVGVMNWQDRTMATEVNLDGLGLPAGSYHIFNYWPGRYMGLTNSAITIDRHQPHEMVILLLKKASEQPELLTTSFHVAQTLEEVLSVERSEGPEGAMTLSIVLERAGNPFGELWVTFPPALKVDTALVEGRPRKVNSAGVGVAHVGLTLNGKTKVEIRFVPVND